VLAHLRGVLGQLERENGWTLAETARSPRTGCSGFCAWRTGTPTRAGMSRAPCGRAARPRRRADRRRDRVVEKGTRFAGVTRPNTVTTRKIDNCQIGVSLPHATGTGRALIDSEPYLPRARTDDRERSRAAGIDDHAPVVATKPQLARCMLPGPRAPDAGVRAG